MRQGAQEARKGICGTVPQTATRSTLYNVRSIAPRRIRPLLRRIREDTDEECCEEDPERELVFKDFLHTVLTDADIPHPNPKKEAGNFNLMLAKAGIKTPDI